MHTPVTNLIYFFKTNTNKHLVSLKTRQTLSTHEYRRDNGEKRTMNETVKIHYEVNVTKLNTQISKERNKQTKHQQQ